jgi:outer membrane biosynthesis protein TonB
LPDGLTEKAMEAARRIQFTPAEKDGRRVSQYATINYNFNIY